MNTTSRAARSRGTVRKAGWLAAATMLAVAAFAPGVRAASVTPTPINSGNPACAAFNPTWTQFKLEGASLANGTYTDGTLQVTIANYTASSSGTPGSFDWSSNDGVDAVFVKAGSSKHNLYVYVPESTGDTGLSPQAGTGNGISHLSFCYDTALEPSTAPSTTPSVEPSTAPSTAPSEAPSTAPSTTPSVEPSTAPSVEPSNAPSEAPSTAPSTTPSVEPSTAPSETPSTAPSTGPSVGPSTAPSTAPSTIPSTAPSSSPTGGEAPITSAAPTGGVEGLVGAPGVTPPATDTIAAPASSVADQGWRVALVLIASVLIGALTAAGPRRAARRA